MILLDFAILACLCIPAILYYRRNPSLNGRSRRAGTLMMCAVATFLGLRLLYFQDRWSPDDPAPPDVTERIFILVIPDPGAPAEGILIPWDPTAPIPNMPAPDLLQG